MADASSFVKIKEVIAQCGNLKEILTQPKIHNEYKHIYIDFKSILLNNTTKKGEALYTINEGLRPGYLDNKTVFIQQVWK